MSEPKTPPNEWTLMFYFASDNALAPGIVSQLKSIKNAGFQHGVNVVTYFDPQPPGTPTHIFDVNAVRKLQTPAASNIGFGANDPFVRDLIEDRLWRDEKDRKGGLIRERVIEQLERKKGLTYNPPVPPPMRDGATGGAASEEFSGVNGKPISGPEKSLHSFLDFCADKYPAKHYMLFILGHGLVVGDDVFLFDEHDKEHSVTLIQLGRALKAFKDRIVKADDEAQFEMVSFHSCSMSSVEVAFELQGTVNYMLASQGPAFVGSWPYRQILLRVFNDVEHGHLKTPSGVRNMLEKIFFYVYYNSLDYLLAGYSFDVALCDLREEKIAAITGPIKALSDKLIKGLAQIDNPLLKYSILLAHWKSQSYWQENYTDLNDFCFCLKGYCQDFYKATGNPIYGEIETACDGVMGVLSRPDEQHPDNPVIRAAFAGPDSQYSHGLSVFFPWTRPTADRAIMKRDTKTGQTEYEQYAFNQTSWFQFLSQYWGPEAGEGDIDLNALDRSTMRRPHKNEIPVSRSAALVTPDMDLAEDIASLMFDAEGPLNVSGALDNGKTRPPDPTGDECACGSIKNYLRDTRKRAERGSRANDKVYPLKQLKQQVSGS